MPKAVTYHDHCGSLCASKQPTSNLDMQWRFSQALERLLKAAKKEVGVKHPFMCDIIMLAITTFSGPDGVGRHHFFVLADHAGKSGCRQAVAALDEYRMTEGGPEIVGASFQVLREDYIALRSINRSP